MLKTLTIAAVALTAVITTTAAAISPANAIACRYCAGNGVSLNGLTLNGTRMNGGAAQDAATAGGMQVLAIELPAAC